MTKYCGTLEIDGGIITSIEKGNVDKEGVVRPVCAFNVYKEEFGTPIKVLLFGTYAKTIWEELKDFKTISSENFIEAEEFLISKTQNTTVSFYGPIREVRKNCIVVENPDRLDFTTSIEHSLIEDGEYDEDIQRD
jgi:hypothetical protein